MDYDLAVLGDIVADIVMPIAQLPLLPNEHGWAEALYVELGGSCNTLVAARHLNLSAVTLATIGDDDYGYKVRQMLAEEGVDVSYLHLDADRKTILCVVVTDKAGQHVFLGIKDGSPPPPVRDEWLEVIHRSRSLFTTGYTLRDILRPDEALAAMQVAHQSGVPVFFDPGPSITHLSTATLEMALLRTDVLLLTADEAHHLVPETAPEHVARALRDFGPSVVVLKAGQDGCYVAADDTVFHQPGYKVEVVDTVGAGDAFVAAFIAGYLRGGNLRECAALANAMGAAMVTRRGAGRNAPDVASLSRLLDGHPASRLLAAGQSASGTAQNS